MPGDVSRPLSKDEKIGAARGICGLVKDDLQRAADTLDRVKTMIEDENAILTPSTVSFAKELVERDIGYLAHLEQEIGPFLSSKEVTVKNGSAAGIDV